MKKYVCSISVVALALFGSVDIKSATAGVSRCTEGPNRGSYCFKLGDRGGRIYSLIEDLRCAGYYRLRNDSYYGPVTVRAVRDFQGDNGIYPDGVAGPQTRNLLRRQAARCGR